MRAAVMHGAGDVRIETVPDARLIEPTDALVRVTRACICGSDLWPYKTMSRSRTGRRMGHEAIGVIEDIGPEVGTLKARDLVVMPFAYSDGTCAFCREGLQTACIHGGLFGREETSAERRPRPFAFRRPTEPSSRYRRGRTRR
jgi:threonine dehydrogenase-like Zn-dependent dehydrogenase